MSRALWSADAELSVIGACLLDPEAIGAVRDLPLLPPMLADATHRAVLAAILRLNDAGTPVDALTVHHALVADGMPDAAAHDVLRRADDACASPASVGAHATIIREYALRRAVQHAGETLVHGAGDQRVSVAEVLDHAERTLHGVRPEQRHAITPLRDALRATMGAFEARMAEPRDVTGVPSGFPDLDRETLGWQPGDLVILAARPSVGKTAMALQWATAACRAGHRVLAFSLEMSTEQLTQRLLAQVGGVPLMGIRKGDLQEPGQRRLTRAVHEMASWDLAIDDTAGTAIGDLRARARRHHRERPVGLVVVDYLQLCSAPGAENRNAEVSDISRGLKGLAKDLGCPVLALSQLSRGGEKEGREPMLADLRDSGAIEQDADVVAFLHRPTKGQANDTGAGVILLAKNRQGAIGRSDVVFRRSAAMFESLASLRAESAA